MQPMINFFFWGENLFIQPHGKTGMIHNIAGNNFSYMYRMYYLTKERSSFLSSSENNM